MIHNVFNEDLLTQCVKLKFKEQHKDPIPLPTIINKKRNMKWKKLGNIENVEEEHNTWYIRRAMEINMTNG